MQTVYSTKEHIVFCYSCTSQLANLCTCCMLFPALLKTLTHRVEKCGHILFSLDLDFFAYIKACTAIWWIWSNKKAADSQVSPQHEIKITDCWKNKDVRTYCRCMMTNTRLGACQGRMQISRVYHIFNHSPHLLNTLDKTWPRSAAVLLCTSHQVKAECFLSVQVKNDESQKWDTASCWLHYMQQEIDADVCSSHFAWRIQEKVDLPVICWPPWITYRLKLRNVLTIRNIIYNLGEWAVTKMVSSEENELTGLDCFLYLTLAAVWALPSASLILVINCDEKKVVPAVRHLNTPLMEQVIVSNTVDILFIGFFPVCSKQTFSL